jgi:cellulose synthase/poly-beta-1,6-N-acetylglucosamine synthase-like glycosyltransferase
VSIGIFAHNDAATVSGVVGAFVAQAQCDPRVVEVVLVSCASTDGTVAAARHAAGDSPLFQVVEHPRREGKVRAIEDFFARAQGTVLVLCGGGTVPADDALARLVDPLDDLPTVGVVGGRVVPVGPPTDLAGRLDAALGRLHHLVAREDPELGEIVALRSRLTERERPEGMVCDEVVCEHTTRRSGLALRYDVEPLAYNRPPDSLRALFAQRRRFACQHRAARRLLGYVPATYRTGAAAAAVVRLAADRPRDAPTLCLLMAVEALARTVAVIDCTWGRYATWARARGDA